MQIIGQYFDQWFGPRWPLVFMTLVMFLPYGIVGTWRMRKAGMKEGWERIVRLVKK